MLTDLIGAHEIRDIDFSNDPSSCLNSAIDELTLLKMMKEQADVMHRIYEKHAEFSHVEGERRALNLMLSKELHGCFQSALLW